MISKVSLKQVQMDLAKDPSGKLRIQNVVLWRTRSEQKWAEGWLALSTEPRRFYIFEDGILGNVFGGLLVNAVDLPEGVVVEKFSPKKKLKCLFCSGIVFRAQNVDEKLMILTTSKIFRNWFIQHLSSVQYGFTHLTKPPGVFGETFFYPLKNSKRSEGHTSSLSPSNVSKPPEERSRSEPKPKPNSPESESGNLDGGLQLKVYVLTWNLAVRRLVELHSEKLGAAIPKDCNVYVLGVQECINPKYFEFFERFLPHCRHIRLENDRVFGRGDRSFINPKFTGIGVYVSKSLMSQTSVKCSKGVSIGKMEGSKGSAAFAMTIGQTTLAFVSSHFPVRSLEYRAMSYQYVNHELGKALGNTEFALYHQFHHVFYMGDFNYILQDISLSNALVFLEGKSLAAMRIHDSLARQIQAEKSFYGCREPIGAPNFFPTYKLKETRPEGFDHKNYADYYILVFKKPWYKMNDVVKKLPSFTDRILVSSIPSMQKMISPQKGNGPHHQYGVFSPDMIGSDHRAVHGLFNLTVPRSRISPQIRVFMIKIESIFVFAEPKAVPEKQRIKALIDNAKKNDEKTAENTNEKTAEIIQKSPENAAKTTRVKLCPVSAKMMFPAPYEDGNDKGKVEEFLCFSNRAPPTETQLKLFETDAGYRFVRGRRLDKKPVDEMKVDKTKMDQRRSKTLGKFKTIEVGQLVENLSTTDDYAESMVISSESNASRNSGDEIAEMQMRINSDEKKDKKNVLKDNDGREEDNKESDTKEEKENKTEESEKSEKSEKNEKIRKNEKTPNKSEKTPNKSEKQLPEVPTSPTPKGLLKLSLQTPPEVKGWYMHPRTPDGKDSSFRRTGENQPGLSEVCLVWKTREMRPTLHLMAEVAFPKGHGQCAVGIDCEKLEEIEANRRPGERVVLAAELTSNGLPLKNLTGQKLCVELAVSFSVS